MRESPVWILVGGSSIGLGETRPTSTCTTENTLLHCVCQLKLTPSLTYMCKNEPLLAHRYELSSLMA